MIADDITPQAVVHDNGAIVASTGRSSFVYALGGRSLPLSVEPLDVYYVRLPAEPRWDDGSPLSPAELDRLVVDVRATFEHWGERCDLVRPDDPRILRGLDQLVTYLRAEALQ